MINSYRYIEIPLAETLTRIEWSGVRVDTEKLEEISQEFEERLDELRERIHEQAEENFRYYNEVELDEGSGPGTANPIDENDAYTFLDMIKRKCQKKV